VGGEKKTGRQLSPEGEAATGSAARRAEPAAGKLKSRVGRVVVCLACLPTSAPRPAQPSSMRPSVRCRQQAVIRIGYDRSGPLGRRQTARLWLAQGRMLMEAFPVERERGGREESASERGAAP